MQQPSKGQSGGEYDHGESMNILKTKTRTEAERGTGTQKIEDLAGGIVVRPRTPGLTGLSGEVLKAGDNLLVARGGC